MISYATKLHREHVNKCQANPAEFCRCLPPSDLSSEHFKHWWALLGPIRDIRRIS
ncbi:hypothetical protein C1H46_039922 [Malus baccata]|uniref:Uncharacterized protein n=1 Tax=Malus baccata TaxID=106549 RepID=A0A540KKK5_MALBA|nr:hypothetical protein C1H46_039922 [Malus baccata]